MAKYITAWIKKKRFNMKRDSCVGMAPFINYRKIDCLIDKAEAAVEE